MPVQPCASDGRPGYRWGASGKCYTFPSGDDSARGEAKRKAYLQGAAATGGTMKAAEPLLVALSEQPVEQFAEGQPLPFVRVGEHSFTDYGDVHITDDDLDRIVRNFEANARRGDLPLTINEEHYPAVYNDAGEVQMGPGAIGWIKSMWRDGDTVMFTPDWNAAGEKLLEEDRYRGVSPELLLNWTDPETNESWGLTAAGVALTNKPRMKSLAFQGKPISDQPALPRVLAYSEHASALDMADGGGGGAGDGKVPCPTCGGDGKIMGNKRACPDCDGSGKVTPAQAKKLKGAEGGWDPDGDGDDDSSPETDTDHGIWTHGGALTNRGKAALEAGLGGHDPDEDGDNDLTAEGDTDHDVWTVDGKLTPKGLAALKAGAKTLKSAELSTAKVNDLPDSDFAHIEPGGSKDESGKTTPRSLRHFPIHDEAHVRNALARASQSPFGAKALPKIRAAAKRLGIKVSSAELGDVHVDRPLSNFSVAYAYPQTKRLPLMTAEQVKGARARFLSIDAAEEERDQAWSQIRQAADRHGVAVPQSWRELNASECASLLKQELLEMNGDGLSLDIQQDAAAGMLAPCTWQPPFSEYGRCPGFTRDDPDNDGDSDCCAMAGKGCNGYQPVVPIQPTGGAIFGSPQSPTYYRERERPGGSMTRTPDTASEEVATSVKASEPAPEPVVESPATPPTPEPKPAPPAEPVAATAAAPAPVPEQPPAQHGADFSEMQAILAAERREREAMATRLAAAEANVQQEREARLRMETAARMAEIANRVEGLVRSGRITPAQRELLMQDPARFSEDDHLLKVLEAAPENSVVDMRERGTGTEESQPEGQRLEAAAKALMSERQQSTSPNDPQFFRNYKTALLEVGRNGYRTQ